MTVVLHVVACLAVWFVVAAAMGCFVGKFIERGRSDRRLRPVVNPEDIAELEAVLRGVETKREVVEA